MNQITPIKDAQEPRSVVRSMASRYGMEAKPFEQTLRATVVPKQCTVEQFAAFLLVAQEHKLNPVTKEIYAFPSRAGGIQPIVSIDGWMNIINSHPKFDGMEFKDNLDDEGKLQAITCRMYRKDRAHPIEVTEYMSECRRDTDPWRNWPARMLRHKAAIQCARYCFGFSGIVDEDEYERAQLEPKDVTPAPEPPAPPPADDEPADAPETIEIEAEAVEVEAEPPADYDAMIEDLKDRLTQAKDNSDLQSEIWESEIAIKIEDGDIFPPDAAALEALVSAA